METQHSKKQPNIQKSKLSFPLNFPNISFFGKYFKAQKGVSPKFYRKAYIGKKRDTLTMPLSATK